MNRSLKILMIEDDAIEVMKFNRAVSSLNLPHKIVNAENGEDALKILEQKDRLPDIILLDLNMPKVGGIEFLTIIKKNANLIHIPVIVLSTSSNQKDLLECYRVGISGYLLKPLKYIEYVSKIDKLLRYWEANQLITL